jgi:hypothetical protein
MFESVMDQFDVINTALRLYRRANPTLNPPPEFSDQLQSDICLLAKPLSHLRDITKQVQSREFGSIGMILPLSIATEKIALDCANHTVFWVQAFGNSLQFEFSKRITKHYKVQNEWKGPYIIAAFLSSHVRSRINTSY